MKNIEYEEIKLLKQSEKNTVLLVREMDGEKLFIQKILKGQHHIYSELLNWQHPYLPELYEVEVSDNATTIIEEYIAGESLESAELSEKQVCNAIKELCSVLEFLHGKGIIHRDIKPSNIMLAKDGHIRLIDFDAARMPKYNLEQDTRLLGTKGYAPPEQYGFAQTDARADIYSLGVTLEQLLGEKAQKPRYKRIIQKCTNLNPDKRYQSAQQVKWAFSYMKRSVLCSAIAILLVAILWNNIPHQLLQHEESQTMSTALTMLPVPENPHWNGETGIALFDNVFESGSVKDEVAYIWRLYKMDTPPTPDEGGWVSQSGMHTNISMTDSEYQLNLGSYLQGNGTYYFTVSAMGDGVKYADSPFVVSDAFTYTGESAPPLSTPTGLRWNVQQRTDTNEYYATLDNYDDYADTDIFEVTVYDQFGGSIGKNIWSKEFIKSKSYKGVWVSSILKNKASGNYRFIVRVITSRPNEYSSSPMPDPVPEEYYSPWLEVTE